MYAGLKDTTSSGLATWFVKLLLKLKRKTAIVCRDCGFPVAPDIVAMFVIDGCPVCGSTKLRMQ